MYTSIYIYIYAYANRAHSSAHLWYDEGNLNARLYWAQCWQCAGTRLVFLISFANDSCINRALFQRDLAAYRANASSHTRYAHVRRIEPNEQDALALDLVGLIFFYALCYIRIRSTLRFPPPGWAGASGSSVEADDWSNEGPDSYLSNCGCLHFSFHRRKFCA